ncbi:glycosyltransferase [Streptosporangium carneum]|uniref:Glycosyl transferase family 1 domain-containing protein n=1 Tax=Streptosporangium carneum TaxID=47481 RepID=A0A9W6IAX9_9ACTN|nr:glycosyltransferase [Streptosporangium carneum]GLK14354.1 hypothetical protein GCM10017600_77660 [Streptosporangium carneum]
MIPQGIQRRLTQRLQTYREVREQRLPDLRVSATPRGDGPAIRYLCPDLSRPSGGIRAIYRHVDTLTAAGFDAAVLHRRKGFSCSWFEHRTPVVSAETAGLHRGDVLVLPEYAAPALGTLPEGLRLVVFNQNAYNTFALSPFDEVPRGAPYAGVPALEAVLAVSEPNVAYLRFAYPDLWIERVRNVVDPALFHPGDAGGAGDTEGTEGTEGTVRARRIALMPRRRAGDLAQVLHLLRARGALDGWEVVPIHGRSEAETAALLRSCAVFFSLSHQEGFGMPPAEAMASGCYVVGFTGVAGQEFFDPAFCSPVPEGDVLAFAQTAERVLAEGPAALAGRARAAGDHIRARYGPDQQREDLVGFFGKVLG